jgi:tripartite-type tricarboxylate transporter receptor subunit TctC
MNWSNKLKALSAASIAIGLISTTGSLAAQPAYPDKTIKIIVGFPAGSIPDITARLLGDKLQASMGKPVITENAPGAGGNIASSRLAKAEPDGYTLYLAGNGSMVINPSLYEKLPYDPVKDMAPISLVNAWPNVLAVANDVPAKTVQELVALAKTKPDELTYGHGGLGISQHLAAELFKQKDRLAIRPVAYTSGTNVLPDVVAGRVNLCFCALTNAMSLAREGKLRALAVTSLERSAFAPELPTMAESGYPGFHATAWFGLMAPAGTPSSIIDRLHGEVAKAVKSTDVRKKLDEQGIVTIGSTPAELAAVIKSDTAYWAKLINAIGLKLK